MQLLLEQKAVIRELLYGYAKLLYLVGSIRSGKSFIAMVCLMAMINRLAKLRRKGHFILAGHSVESVRTNLIEPYLIPLMEERHWVFKDRGGSRPRIETRRSIIQVFGGADRRSEHRMRGMTASGAVIDEIAKVEESFFFQCIERCSANKARIITTTNKRGNYDWEKIKVVDRISELRGKIFELALQDNKFLDPEYVDWVSSALTGHYNVRDVLNLYAEATGLVYTDYTVEEPTFAWYDLPKYLGVDWAQSGVTAGLALVQHPVLRHKYYVVDEYYQSNELTGLDHHGHTNAMCVQWNNIEEGRCDPSAPYIKQAFERAGKYMLFADNDVLRGLAAVHGALFRRELIISPRCVNLLSELQSYAWREPTKGGTEEHPIKRNDHAADALRYICVYLFPADVLQLPISLGTE